jgi:hypothetical protein
MKIKIKIKTKVSEKGQALAEYMPLIPPALLLSAAVMVPLSEASSDVYCDVANELNPGECVMPEEEEGGMSVWEAGDVDQYPTPTPDAGDEGDGEETGDDEACTVLQESEGGSQCDQDPECTKLPGNNAGTYYADDVVDNLVIKAGKEYHVYESGVTADGCYNVTIYSNLAAWEKVGSGSGCKDVSHTQVWMTPLCVEN